MAETNIRSVTNEIFSKRMNIRISVRFDDSTKSKLKIHSLFCLYEPFGLGRFATDHFLTKFASRPLFVRVRHYTTQLTSASRPCPPQKITIS